MQFIYILTNTPAHPPIHTQSTNLNIALPHWEWNHRPLKGGGSWPHIGPILVSGHLLKAWWGNLPNQSHLIYTGSTPVKNWVGPSKLQQNSIKRRWMKPSELQQNSFKTKWIMTELPQNKVGVNIRTSLKTNWVITSELQ